MGLLSEGVLRSPTLLAPSLLQGNIVVLSRFGPEGAEGEWRLCEEELV